MSAASVARGRVISYLEPHKDEVPKSEYTQLCGSIACPGPSRIFDGYYVHVVQNSFHRTQTDQEATSIANDFLGADVQWTANLKIKESFS